LNSSFCKNIFVEIEDFNAGGEPLICFKAMFLKEDVHWHKHEKIAGELGWLVKGEALFGDKPGNSSTLHDPETVTGIAQKLIKK